jgi:hypothetical protein
MNFRLPKIPRIAPERMFSIIATTVSVSALCLSFYQASLARRQQYASVWPYLLLGSSNYNPDTKSIQFQLSVANKGVGPAIIEDYEIEYKGKTYSFANGFYEKLPVTTADTLTEASRSDLFPGRVIAPGEVVTLYTFNGSQKTIRKIEREFYESSIRIRFKSVYDEKWEAHYGGKWYKNITNAKDARFVVPIED